MVLTRYSSTCLTYTGISKACLSLGDFFVFKAEAVDDLRQFMRLHSISNADDALLIMYQATPPPKLVSDPSGAVPMSS